MTNNFSSYKKYVHLLIKKIGGKRMKNKKIFLILIATVMMFSMMMATAYATNISKVDTKNGNNVILSKTKTVDYKITWNYNGGKIGAKKTTLSTVKKGNQIKKLATTPKRTGYTFKGWYTKKSGGAKIAKNTKPKKSTTYYAQWTKTTSATKIRGSWVNSNLASGYWYNYYFYPDGRFEYYNTKMLYYGSTVNKVVGKYSVSNGKVYFKEMKYTSCGSSTITENLNKFKEDYPKWKFSDPLEKWNGITIIKEYKLGSDTKGNYLEMYNHLSDIDEKTYYDLSSASKHYKN